MNSREKRKRRKLENDRKKLGKSNPVSENFATEVESMHRKYAERVGISDRTLEKIRTIKEASTESEILKKFGRKLLLVK